MPRLTLLSRRSDLAVLQADSVRRALLARWPDLDVGLTTRQSAGDRDQRQPLATAADKGLFTQDLSDALVAGQASAVVHSWKDLPLEARGDTVVAGTLERADPRDLLVVRRDVVTTRPDVLRVLTSSPRRAWQLHESLAPLLPWPTTAITPCDVRGNVPTRLAALLERRADALVVAKAALDRLLSSAAPVGLAARIRDRLAECQWMVLPLRDFPTAPAQGALAIEVAREQTDLIDRVRAVSHAPTEAAVLKERDVLAWYGGGCHLALGATVLVRPYGQVQSVRGRVGDADPIAEWILSADQPQPPPTDAAYIWPRPDERRAVRRRPLDVTPPEADGYWVSRADAMPDGFRPDPARPIWAAGTRTWHKLAARGLWVHGCADGLGEDEAPGIDALVGRRVDWLRLTHQDAAGRGALATYTVEWALPPDLPSRTHFFWTSGTLFRRALAHHPSLAGAWHAAGPGRTGREIRDRLGPSDRVSIWLDYDQWHQQVIP